jgi:hypothetical protein
LELLDKIGALTLFKQPLRDEVNHSPIAKSTLYGKNAS